MNIYLFERNDSHDFSWEQYFGFVVSAKDVKEARDLINTEMKENQPVQNDSWFNVKLIGYKIDSKSEIILSDYNNG